LGLELELGLDLQALELDQVVELELERMVRLDMGVEFVVDSALVQQKESNFSGSDQSQSV